MKRIITTIILFLFFSANSFSAAKTFKTFAPKDGMTITNNTPTLAWGKIKCDRFEIRIDNRIMAELPSTSNTYVVFPLSFGKHNWAVIAHIGKTRIISATSTFLVQDAPLAELPKSAQLLRHGWKVKSSVEINMDGSGISKVGVNTNRWAETSLPATVLTALVRNGIYPNPYIGMNNMRIPDSNDEYNKDYNLQKFSHLKNRNPWKDHYWFRNEFVVDKNNKGKTVWLNFSEINYKAQVWLNGKIIADTTEIKGMERSFRIDITKNILKSGINCLAVAIFPVDNPGKPAIEPLLALSDPGQNMGDGKISTSYTKWDTMGWDWQPAVRDRDMGITEDVFISFTDETELQNLYVTSEIDLSKTADAQLTVSLDIKNYTSVLQTGTAHIKIHNGADVITFDKKYEIQPNELKSFEWNNENTPELTLKNAKLWWPAGYGSPNLYNIEITAKTSNGNESYINDVFGIRKVETYIGKKERVYKINGKEIYLKGGNWVIDMMLNWTSSRYENEILLTKNANLNILRVWGPTGVPPKALYRAADKHGILMWQDYLNDFWGTNKNTPGYQPEISLFEKASINITQKLRNHPSLIIWCGGNEGVNPREDLLVNSVIKKYDNRGTRHYLKQSDGDGLHGGGPYHTLEPKDYFTHPKLQGFSSEIGPSGIPVMQSMLKFMPEMGKNWMSGRFPLDGFWAYHDANDWPGEDSRKFTSYDTMLRNYYGAPDTLNVHNGIKEYISKAQLVNYDVYRSSIESINRQLWNNSSGILLWKSNSSWPSITWQVYDWYMQAHAGYYGAKKASELVHVQFNRDNNSVSFLNLTSENLDNNTVSAALYDINANMVWNKNQKLNMMEANSTISTDIIVPVSDKTQFLKLEVKNEMGTIISENLYWVNALNKFNDLNQLPETNLQVEARISEGVKANKYIVEVKNTRTAIAFMFNARISGKDSHQELLPSLWSDNYFSLLPGESKTINAEIKKEDITETPVLEYTLFGKSEPIFLPLSK
jgi:beta-galactosidase/beta-glucuronidase